MKAEYQDFIAIYHDVYPKGYCQHLINEFERLVLEGVGHNRQASESALKHNKDDLSVGMNNHELKFFNDRPPALIFNDGLQLCFNEYVNEYSVLKQGNVRSTFMKAQRTDSGGGYHVWHGEQGNGAHANRVLTFILYLNTLEPESAGETEFLYIQRRVRPVENTMVIWPASFTHAHRGNTVFNNNSKYIITGWFYYD